MTQARPGRRAFLERSALALGAASLPLEVLAQTTLKIRPEWQAFKTTPRYDSLLKAVRLMKANTNAADPNSWAYWTSIHLNKCPHSIPYFLAWHRGYLYHFERRLRTVSGDSLLVLPYWDYYSYPNLPAEFTNPNNANPLFVARINTNVRPVLTMAPFAPTVLNFQRGTSNAFETLCEDAPHNPVHDLIGGVMATMESPIDPIFWLHHANIDRLWVAWVSAGGGRKMPATTNAYWSGTHVYNSSLSLSRLSTYSNRSSLGYRYANEALPTRLPLARLADPNIRRAQAGARELASSLPPVGSFRIPSPRETGKGRFALSGAEKVGLDENSLSVQLPISAEHARTLAAIGGNKAGRIPGRADTYRSVHITLDSVELAELAKQGGFYYELYLNIPSRRTALGRPLNLYIGNLGAFKINSAAHHGGGAVQLRYPIRRHLAGALADELSALSLSFVRINGDHSPRGGVIGVGELRLEVSTEDDE
ncbi:tyrosinase family protein [Massilia sp. IC2-477]|uniref:tyrosinase family protein n=1 Tax=unclassified Massilia TaxID=2609279 RepID=UPI001D11FB5E|nr:MULTISPECIES: tyrosinase family protein [unclassified Massilia]MCC2955014.1 tyrosinase family protein [Massilia sp. IC2-477]MCC2973008.1 tyrosinase family protein [Massilia sp. IC2-476]